MYNYDIFFVWMLDELLSKVKMELYSVFYRIRLFVKDFFVNYLVLVI